MIARGGVSSLQLKYVGNGMCIFARKHDRRARMLNFRIYIYIYSRSLSIFKYIYIYDTHEYECAQKVGHKDPQVLAYLCCFLVLDS